MTSRYIAGLLVVPTTEGWEVYARDLSTRIGFFFSLADAENWLRRWSEEAQSRWRERKEELNPETTRVEASLEDLGL
jgi:hypothetical protein